MSHSVASSQPQTSHRNSLPLIFRIGFWICIAIAAAAVLRRIVALFAPSTSGPPDMVRLDAIFVGHRLLTLLHIVPALLLVLLLPFVFSRSFHERQPRLWSIFERSLFPLGLIVGITAYAMTRESIGGWIERSAVLLFNPLYLGCLVRAYAFEQTEAGRHLWLLRAFAILLGIATTRPVMGIFFATSRFTHLGPAQFFGIAFWIGFSINTLAMEFWIRTRKIQT